MAGVPADFGQIAGVRDSWGQSKITENVGNSSVGGDFTLTPEFPEFASAVILL